MIDLPFRIHPGAQATLGLSDTDIACLLGRFAKYLKVPDTEPGTCWTWAGNRQVSGDFGMVHFSGRRERTNRVAFVLANGRWPDNFALHHCDNAPCSRPDHLYDGTAKDNARDACERGKFRKKLTAKQARRIKLAGRRLRPVSSVKLAREFGVDPSNVRQIWAGKIWAHVDV